MKAGLTGDNPAPPQPQPGNLSPPYSDPSHSPASQALDNSDSDYLLSPDSVGIYSTGTLYCLCVKSRFEIVCLRFSCEYDGQPDNQWDDGQVQTGPLHGDGHHGAGQPSLPHAQGPGEPLQDRGLHGQDHTRGE